MKTSPIIVNEIRRLSQEEGYKDTEIAEVIQYSRIAIQRIRKENNIPPYKKEMRKDKEVTCCNCNRKFLIRRIENTVFCPECTEKINNQKE